MAGPVIHGRTVIFSTQLITTLTALTHVFSEPSDVTEITIVAIRYRSFERHFELINLHVVPYVQSRGIRCQIVYEDEITFDSYRSDVLILPRIDHRHSAAFIERVKPSTIIETGESIGVEPQLYSLKRRYFREKAIKKVRNRSYVRDVIHAYVVSLAGYRLSLLQTYLDLCLELQTSFRRPDTEQLIPKQEQNGFTLILLLPFLTQAQDKKVLNKLSHRFRMKLGLQQTRNDQLFHHVLLRQTASFLDRELDKIPNSEPVFIWVKPHPKNGEMGEKIIKTLMNTARKTSHRDVQLISANTPLEEVILSCNGAWRGSGLSILGYGTNLLSAMLFLYPESDHVAMIERSNSQLLRLLGDLFDSLFHRTEFLRRRHVSRLVESLRSGLATLRNRAATELPAGE